MESSSKGRFSKIQGLSQVFFWNAIPLFGVIFLHWEARLLILTYFWETIIAVLFHAVRLWYVHWRWGHLPQTMARAEKLEKEVGATTIAPAFLPLFMLAVFGLFCFVQLMVLGGFAEKSFPEGIFTSMYREAGGKLYWVLTSFVFLQVSTFFVEVIRGKHAGQPAQELFFQPFRRIFVQQLSVILGGFFILFGGTQQYVVLLVLINLAIDLFLLFIDHAKWKAVMTSDDPKAQEQWDELKKMLKD